MSLIEKFEFTEALERDAAALIALWLQIYGGDPPPQEVIVSPALGMVATAIVTQLRGEFGASALSFAELSERLARIGLELGRGEEHDQQHEQHEAGHVFVRAQFTCVKGPDDFPGCCVGVPFGVTQP